MVVRSALDAFVRDLAERENVAGVGLLGGWPLFDAPIGNALDLLVVDGSVVDFEFHELAGLQGLLLDLNRIPWRWVGEVVRPEVDHRLHESRVLYDPTGLLGRAKGFVEDNFRAPGRVEIRAEGHNATADMYLSRSASALTRNDLETASIYAYASLESLAPVLMEVAGTPVSREDLVWNLRRACEALGMLGFFGEFTELGRLSGLRKGDVEGMADQFGSVWRLVSEHAGEHGGVVGGLHEVMRRELGYLTSTGMPGLILSKAGGMLEGGNFAGAAFYLRGWLRQLLEAHAWVICAGRGDKFDYTSLFRIIGGEGGVEGVREGAVGVFGLGGLDRGGVGRVVEGVRGAVSMVRSSRRGLIEGFLGRGG
jgi:hypothetical protein